MKDAESVAEQAYEVQRAYVRNEPGLPDMPSWEQVGWEVKAPYREAARGRSDGLLAVPPMALQALMESGVGMSLDVTQSKATPPSVDGAEVTPARNLAARVAHEVNRRYCESLGDDSQVPWGEAPDWQKESVHAGVAAILADPCITPAKQHEVWLEHKKADGWIYGKAKDPEKKTHPCMVPYNKLPKAQKFKDALFGASVRAVFDL